MFDKKKFILVAKFQILFFVLILVLFLIPTSFSKYSSSSNSSAKLDIAFYLVKTSMFSETVLIEDLVPRTDPYVYNFDISNTDGNNRTETNLEYVLSIKTTTNLPLDYKLYMNEVYTEPGASDIVVDDKIESDSDGTYFRTLTTDTEYFTYNYDETNHYQLIVYFPSEYTDFKYQDLYESIEIKVDSKQVIDKN